MQKLVCHNKVIAEALKIHYWRHVGGIPSMLIVTGVFHGIIWDRYWFVQGERLSLKFHGSVRKNHVSLVRHCEFKDEIWWEAWNVFWLELWTTCILDSNIDAFYQWFRRRRRYWCGHKGILKLCLSFVISSVAPMCAMGKYLGAAMCSEEGSIQMKADRLHRIYGNQKFECISLWDQD